MMKGGGLSREELSKKLGGAVQKARRSCPKSSYVLGQME